MTELVLYLISFIISSIPSMFLSAPPVEDALGTMGASAYVAGYDWSIFLADDGFFYKYGQAIWYTPVFLLINNPVIRYKILLVINSALDAFIAALAYRIGKRFMSDQNAKIAALLSGLMPSVLLYSKYTWAEPVLMLMPWVILYLFVILSEMPEGKEYARKRAIYSFLLAATAVYSFMSHQRGIVIVIATTMTVLIGSLFFFRKFVSGPAYISGLIIFIAWDRLMNSWLRSTVYRGIQPKHNTLSGFLRPEIYQKVFSLEGQKVVFSTLLGWLFNVSVSGACITMLGLGFMFVILFKKKTADSDKKLALLSIQGLLSFAGAFALGVLFFFETLYGYWDGTKVTRCDHLVFGRYLESTYPILMFMGVLALSRANAGLYQRNEQTYSDIGKENDQTAVAIGRLLIIVPVITVTLTAFYVLKLAPVMEGIDSYVHSLMSMNICYDMSGVTLTDDYIKNLPVSLAISAVVAISIFMVIVFLAKWKKDRFLKFAFIIIAVLFLYIYLRSFIDIIYRVDSSSLTKYAQYYLSNG